MRVHHVAFRTRDLDRLERFYTETLGFAVVRRQAHSVWLDANGAIVMLERATEDEPVVPNGSMDLVAFDVRERTDVFERVARAGTAIEGRTDFTIYLRDPDGRRVGLSTYPDPLPR